jgi:16S rRNA (guanine527-N7)-methyltransferase
MGARRPPPGVSDDPLRVLKGAAAAWGADLGDGQIALLSSYLRSVETKNHQTNLTADAKWEDLVLKHAADGIFAASVLRRRTAVLSPSRAPRILDFGSGGGFIGIALKIAWPQADVTLLESVERKYRFLNAECVRLGLSGLRPLKGRAGRDAMPAAYATSFDVVVERAAGPLAEVLPLAFNRLTPRGIFAAFQSEPPDPGDPELANALAVVEAGVLECIPYRRPAEHQERTLALFGRT